MKAHTDDEGDLELLDTETDGDQLRGTPDKALLLNRPNGFLKRLHVGLIVPRLDLESNNGLNLGPALKN